MSKITIVPEDGSMAIDGVSRKISMSGIDPKIHAVQWLDTAGMIEFNDGTPPEVIDDITPFQSFINRWNAFVPQVPEPDPPKAEAAVSVKELITQMIFDGTMTPEKIAAIKAAR